MRKPLAFGLGITLTAILLTAAVVVLSRGSHPSSFEESRTRLDTRLRDAESEGTAKNVQRAEESLAVLSHSEQVTADLLRANLGWKQAESDTIGRSRAPVGVIEARVGAIDLAQGGLLFVPPSETNPYPGVSGLVDASDRSLLRTVVATMPTETRDFALQPSGDDVDQLIDLFVTTLLVNSDRPPSLDELRDMYAPYTNDAERFLPPLRTWLSSGERIVSLHAAPYGSETHRMSMSIRYRHQDDEAESERSACDTLSKIGFGCRTVADGFLTCMIEADVEMQSGRTGRFRVEYLYSPASAAWAMTEIEMRPSWADFHAQTASRAEMERVMKESITKDFDMVSESRAFLVRTR